jgi:excisionase family DNA binding protein
VSDTTTEPKLYTAGEVATLLGLQPRTIRDYIRSGELQSVNVGRAEASRPTLRVRAAELERFLTDRAKA